MTGFEFRFLYRFCGGRGGRSLPPSEYDGVCTVVVITDVRLSVGVLLGVNQHLMWAGLHRFGQDCAWPDWLFLRPRRK